MVAAASRTVVLLLAGMGVGARGLSLPLRRGWATRLAMGTDLECGEDALAKEFAAILAAGQAAEELGDGITEVGAIPKSPSPEISPEEVVRACNVGLKYDDVPMPDHGFGICYAFADNMCKAANAPRGRHSTLEYFIKFANNPTFGSMVNMKSFELLGECNEIEGSPTRGALATQLVQIETKEGRERKFLWTLQKQRRPPLTDCWLVHEVLATEMAYYQTL
mmetsp:Transcript_46684/g.145804  ORF Transcript_46684/g.145804 Transcript_46684/m.145804 type:complete len:221 (-) Transcript_46684:180-842(-)|eukprot:CAMPEP_0118851338 /NCGR_PEP_ID=MMETSP1163-20130328/817_1 /TAXON_ID=124430 /ORGANISM="Phaeomonas parva, Strain CCMP2877" /LENGTH=220 /DNA_ID=CAMNT_0006783657 /DNA_START=83 /DNA_END=745 /DNA_ORIENTATION=-